MPTVINTNLASLFAQNSLTNAQNNLAQSVQRLSSGLRINSAKDDAAGLAIAQLMQSNINGVNQSIRNTSNATNLLQTADTGLSTVQDMLLRMKQLSVQGYDGSLSAAQKVNIVTELKDLRDEINATATRTTFNNINLLGGAQGVDAAVGDVYAGTILNLTPIADAVDPEDDSFIGDITQGVEGASEVAEGQVTGTLAYYELLGDPNSDAFRSLPGTYTFHAEANQLTMFATINGIYKSQTLTVGDAVEGGEEGNTTQQSLDFTSFGIRLFASTTVAIAGDSISGEDIASDFEGLTIAIAGESAKITDINVAGVRAGTYAFTHDGTAGEDPSTLGKLTLNYLDPNVDGATLADNIIETKLLDLKDFAVYDAVADDYIFKAGSTTTLNFPIGGSNVSMSIHAYQDMLITDIADLIVAMNHNDLGEQTGELVVAQGTSDALKFQSGPNSDSFIQINTLNLRTDSSSSNLSMRTLGAKVDVLADLNAADDVDAWQNAFMQLDSAIESAQVYLSQERAVFGSQMNRVGYLSTNLTSQSTNLQNSRSSIIDTDFASETAKLTRGQIMQQAATAMLAQANQMPNVVLSLLK